MPVVGSNSMTDLLIIGKAIEEIKTKSFGTTEQFLAVHEVVYDNDMPKAKRVDIQGDENTAIVYFPVKGVSFYLAVYLDTEPEISVRHVGTEPCSIVYFRATSDTLSLSDISGLTRLGYTSGWDKGDKRKLGDLRYNFSAFHFEPNPEPDELKDKLNKLLDFLESDKSGVASLVEKANGYIQVAIYYHYGSSSLGGIHLNRELMKRLSALNLELDFDLYAEGNPFKD